MKGKLATISTNELRFSFEKVLKAMEQGRSLLLTYRNKPLARIEPYSQPREQVGADDPIFDLPRLADSLGSLSNEEIDKIICGQGLVKK